MSAEENAVEVNATHVFFESKLGKILKKAAAQSSWCIITEQFYVLDYVRFVYAAQSCAKEKEYKVWLFTSIWVFCAHFVFYVYT